jgi:hypothetical protein
VSIYILQINFYNNKKRDAGSEAAPVAATFNYLYTMTQRSVTNTNTRGVKNIRSNFKTGRNTDNYYYN